MRPAAPKRRLRVRRKPRGAAVADVIEGAGNELVTDLGCCLIEAVASASVLVALLAIPLYLLSR